MSGCAVPQVSVVSEYPHSTLNGTPTYSSHSGIVFVIIDLGLKEVLCILMTY